MQTTNPPSFLLSASSGWPVADRNAKRSAGGNAALVTTAKSRALQEYQGFAGRVDPETGEIEQPKGSADGASIRLSRFALQSVARSVLPNSRTAFCLRNRAKGRDVEILRSVEHGSTSYAGLQTCGSVWTCPVCAAKIAERRRAEMLGASAVHQAQGGGVLFLTLTNPHYSSTVLADLMAGQRKAIHSLMRNKAGRTWFARMGVVGHIRALEVTHGANGWHPHFHLILFCRSEVEITPELVREGSDAWRAACVGAGLPLPSHKHGFSLQDGAKAATYASKWGLEDEMTKGHIKKGRAGSETPFDLLRRVLADKGDKVAARLFREFAEQFKGARQLVWSRGLKARFSVAELDDSELANKAEDCAVVLGKLTVEQWRRVLAADGRGLVLELARSGWEAVELYLVGLRTEGEGVSSG